MHSFDSLSLISLAEPILGAIWPVDVNTNYTTLNQNDKCIPCYACEHFVNIVNLSLQNLDLGVVDLTDQSFDGGFRINEWKHPVFDLIYFEYWFMGVFSVKNNFQNR